MAKILKYILFFGIGLLLLFLAFKNQNPSELISQLKNVNYTWVLLSMVFFTSKSGIFVADRWSKIKASQPSGACL